MFTVIFAEKETIKLFEETKMFFGPLLNNEKVAFCEWHKYADTLDLMVPQLYDLIEYKSEWRAVILYDEDRNRLNPFDYTMYQEPFYSEEQKDGAYYETRRMNRFSSYEKAVSNPLVKLTTALCEVPNLKSVISDGTEFENIVSGTTGIFEFMLKRQLEAVNVSEVTGRLEKFQRQELLRFVKEDDIDSLIEFVKNKDVSGIAGLIPDTGIAEFVKFIGNDPVLCDPEYTECLIENTKKAYLLNTVTADFSMKDKVPAQIICLAPRTFDFENSEQDVKWKNRDESSSSRFADFNLYNEKLKFLLFDVLPKDHKQYKFDRIKLMCVLLIIANYALPKGVVNPGRVYRTDIDFDDSMISRICETYISKLKSTQLHLKDIERALDNEHETSIDDKTAQRLFESDIIIPVEIKDPGMQYDLYAKYKDIGLATDTPKHEDVYWSGQYRDITKKFVKYLREPRRAVKTAVSEGFHKNNSIDDDRALILSETQAEDVGYRLLEEEQKMVSTVTSQIFDVKNYNEQIQQADKEIRQEISKRMTKKKTGYVFLFSALAYLVGFLPLIFSNLNTVKSVTCSLLMTGITIAAFSAVGFFYLFVLRKKLINRFKHFNYVMSGICRTIMGGLSQFSKYLSSACNVMREFSVLKKRESAVSRIKRILSYHNLKIDEQIKTVSDMFSKYIDFRKITVKECDPYDFDFTVMKDYEYSMPSLLSIKKIEYCQPGNEITVPVDYVDSITLTREELYD